MPHAFVTRLEEGLTGCSFVDATDFLDRLKPNELSFVRGHLGVSRAIASGFWMPTS